MVSPFPVLKCSWVQRRWWYEWVTKLCKLQSSCLALLLHVILGVHRFVMQICEARVWPKSFRGKGSEIEAGATQVVFYKLRAECQEETRKLNLKTPHHLHLAIRPTLRLWGVLRPLTSSDKQMDKGQGLMTAGNDPDVIWSWRLILWRWLWLWKLKGWLLVGHELKVKLKIMSL